MTPVFDYLSSTWAISDQAKWWRYLPDLVRGDWMLLPAGTPHRLVSTQPGTNWLAVHLHPVSSTGDGGGV